MEKTVMIDTGKMERFEEIFEEELYDKIQEMDKQGLQQATISARFVIRTSEYGEDKTFLKAEIPLAMTMKIEKEDGVKG